MYTDSYTSDLRVTFGRLLAVLFVLVRLLL